MGILAVAASQALLLATDPSTAPAVPATTTGSQTLLDQYLPFINFGIIGILVVLVITKTGFVPRWALDSAEGNAEKDAVDAKAAHEREIALLRQAIDQLQADKAELKASNDQLTRVAQEQFLPALIEANRLTALYVETLARRGQT